MQGFRAVFLALDCPARQGFGAYEEDGGESSRLDQAAEILDRSADDTPGDLAARGDHERAGEGADGNELVEFSRDKVAWVI
jgi:hypothetical protein